MTKTWLVLALATAGCMTGPESGATTSVANVAGKTFTFGGYFNEPNATILLEVLKDPKLDPNKDASWIGFAITYSGTSEVNINDSDDPLYEWSVVAAPVPANASAISLKRWPQGGIVRIRASQVNEQTGARKFLTTFDQINSDCVGKGYVDGKDWQVIGTECEGLGDKTIALVSTSTLPTPAGGFLTAKGVGSTAITDAYYAKINAPRTLSSFRTQFGFNSDPAAVVSARYYNDGDLGLGREMNCKTFTPSPFVPLGVACYVRNYSGVDGAVEFNRPIDEVIAQTVEAQHPFATVAMISYGAGNNDVRFIVYDKNGDLLNKAELDVAKYNTSIPQNCLSCHGIDAKFDKQTLTVSNKAEFLPFDPYAYKFSPSAPWRLSDQQEAFRKLNQMVKLTFPPPATVELITGMYAPQSVNTVGATAKNTFIPAAWQTNNTLDGKALYNGVVKPYCRTCHVSSNTPLLDFNAYSDFTTDEDPQGDKRTKIRFDVCGSKKMPHAERVQKKFWESGARAYVVTGLAQTATYPDDLQACKP